MSYCKEKGKDRIIFVTKEDHEAPSSVALPDDAPGRKGLITENGEINWDCPCLGGMATGPCGMEFREAFSCFHHSQTETKGSDCFDKFRDMQTCMAKFPTLYPKGKGDDEDDEKNVSASVVEDKNHKPVTDMSISKEVQANT